MRPLRSSSNSLLGNVSFNGGHHILSDPTLRRVGTRSMFRSYFLAFEGITECRYFEMVRKHRVDLGIHSDIRVINLVRYDQDIGDSNVKFIRDRLDEYIYLLKTGKYSAHLFVGDLMQQLFDLMVGVSANYDEFTKGYHKELSDKQLTNRTNAILKKNQNNLINALKSSEFLKDGIVVDMPGAFNHCLSLIDSESIPSDYIKCLTIPACHDNFYFDEDWDRVCFIFDRDKKSGQCSTRERYCNFLKSCKDANISPYVSTPSFEFWIIMHFDDLMENFDEKSMLENGRDSSSELCYAEKLLHNYLKPGYIKDLSTVEPLLENNCKMIESAMEVAQSYSHRLSDLECKIGTNVHKLIQDMRNNR